ncbi:hypothetical protein BJ973_004004 [Actinoplanes tereljensis]|uniref:Uncharacterized protein n=1 Tax=Paractinoplanes tereljensis TaxID=571912 RepID=A0A919NXY2_9ACTN|nr:hypothetical protein [Actinoplanes tereljensis]GIF25727.1 hypothetical protein Ate02nite_84570 [Actinoplanes tereljensis]
MPDDLADVRAGARLVGLTPFAVETLLLAVRRAGDRAGRKVSTAAWLAGAIVRQAQEESPLPPDRLAAEVAASATDELERKNPANRPARIAFQGQLPCGSACRVRHQPSSRRVRRRVQRRSTVDPHAVPVATEETIMTVNPSENDTAPSHAVGRPGPELSAGPVDIEVGRLRVSAEVRAWIDENLQRFQPQGWTRDDVISDLLSAAHFADAARRETKADRRAKLAAVAEAMAGLTDEQRRVRDHEQAYLSLTFAIGEFMAGLKIADRLGLPVRWVVADGVEGPTPPEPWLYPELVETPSAFVYDDIPAPDAGSAAD